MSLTQWFTRSWPMVSCRSMANAIFSFVPTPSTLETSTGWRYRSRSSANNPPKPPTLPSTSRRCVAASSSGKRGFDLVAQVNVHARGGVSFLFHRGSSKRGCNIREFAAAVENEPEGARVWRPAYPQQATNGHVTRNPHTAANSTPPAAREECRAGIGTAAGRCRRCKPAAGRMIG